MSWGTELWDQYDNIAAHTEKGIDFLEKYGRFVDQRCKIELEYASKLRRLVKTYLPKKKEEEDYQFTYTKAYKNLLNELGDQAGQHEMIAENLSTSVVHELAALVKQLKDDRRKHLNEGARIQAALQSSLSQLNKTKEKYEKAFGASERALDAYKKADADLNLSRAEVEKQRINSTIKSQQGDDSKNEYANQLQKCNEAQRKYYTHLSPAVFQNLQDLDERRIKCIQNFILESVRVEREVLPIISQCLDGMAARAERIDEREDSRLVIERYKSGFSPPGDHAFEDLSNVSRLSGTDDSSNASANGSMSSVQPTSSTYHYHTTLTDKKSILGTITGARVRKRSGLLGLFTNSKGSNGNLFEKDDFSDLAPNQRRKKLQLKIEEITGKICQETAARDGLMKMKQVYESNSALGDPMSIQGQLTDNGQRLDKLRGELKKFQGYLDDMDERQRNSAVSINYSTSNLSGNRTTGSARGKKMGDVVSGVGTLGDNNTSNRRNSVSDGADSLSRSASDSSVSNSTGNHKVVTANNPQLLNHGSSNSPESGIGMSSTTSLPSSDQDHSERGGSSLGTSVRMGSGQPPDLDEADEGGEDDFYDTEPLPALGRCKALYPFEVTSEGSMQMDEGEDLWVIETDQGDGWTRVRRTNISPLDPMPEGFVPSSYIETCELFATPRLV